MDGARVCVCVVFVLSFMMHYLLIFSLAVYVALSLSLFRCLSMPPSSRCPIFVSVCVLRATRNVCTACTCVRTYGVYFYLSLPHSHAQLHMLQNIIPSNPSDFQHALLSSPPVAKVFHTHARACAHTHKTFRRRCCWRHL